MRRSHLKYGYMDGPVGWVTCSHTLQLFLLELGETFVAVVRCLPDIMSLYDYTSTKISY